MIWITETYQVHVYDFYIHFIKCHLVVVNLSPKRALLQLSKYPKCPNQKIHCELGDLVLLIDKRYLNCYKNPKTNELYCHEKS